jgi:hypothetical protein
MKIGKPRGHPPFTLWLAAFLLGAGLPGCVAVSTNDSQVKAEISTEPEAADKTDSGPSALRARFKQVEPGQSKDFILGLLGEPKEKIPEDGGAELWKYPYREGHGSFDSFIFLYANAQTTTLEKNHYIEFKDSVVTKTWNE